MDPDRASPPEMPPGKTAREIRLEREAAALRANLRKRKDQARARVAEETPPLDTSANGDVRSGQGA